MLPRWIALCLLCIVAGATMQVLPGLSERGVLYIDSWSRNLAFADAFSNLNTAEQGFGTADRFVQPAARFPLMPMLTRWGIALFGEASLSAFWVSKAALLVGLIGLWCLVDHLHGGLQANRSIQYLLFPILGTAYSWIYTFPEALHLATWTWGFYLLFKGEYYLCGVVTVLCVWSRPQAILIVIPYAIVLLMEARRARRSLWDALLWRAGLLTCAIPIAAYALWIARISTISELPFAPITAQAAHGRADLLWPWDLIARRIDFMDTRGIFAYQWSRLFENGQLLIIGVCLIVLTVMVIRGRLHPALLIFSLLGVLPGLTTAIFAIGRYATLTWIPLAVLYVIPRRYDSVVLPLLIALSLLALLVAGFSNAAGFIL